MRSRLALLISLCLAGAGVAHADTWTDLWSTREQQAQRLLDSKHPEAAAPLFNDARRRAYAELEAGQFAKAAKSLASFKDADSQYNRGNALAHAGQLREALGAYDAALAAAPGDKDVIRNRDLVKQALEQQQNQGGQQGDSKGNPGSKGSKGGQSQGGNNSPGGGQPQPGQSQGDRSQQGGQSQANQSPQSQQGANQNSQAQANNQGNGSQSQSGGQSGNQAGQQPGNSSQANNQAQGGNPSQAGQQTQPRNPSGGQSPQAGGQAQAASPSQGANPSQSANPSANPSQAPSQAANASQSPPQAGTTHPGDNAPGEGALAPNGQQTNGSTAAGGLNAENAQQDANAALRYRQSQQAKSGSETNPRGTASTLTPDGRASSNAEVPPPKPPSEQSMALDQWLRGIPDDSAELLRRKFLIEHMLKQQRNEQ